MNSEFLHMLSSLGLGAFLGTLLNRLLDALQERTRRRFELQRRYFDLKTETTMQVIRSTKLGTESIRIACQQLDDLMMMARRGSLAPGASEVCASQLGRASQLLEKLREESPGVEGLLGFFYDGELMQMTRSLEQRSLTLRDRLFSFATETTNLKAALSNLPVEQDTARAAILSLIPNLNALQETSAALRKDAETLDAASDDFVQCLRTRYERYAV